MCCSAPPTTLRQRPPALLSPAMPTTDRRRLAAPSAEAAAGAAEAEEQPRPPTVWHTSTDTASSKRHFTSQPRHVTTVQSSCGASGDQDIYVKVCFLLLSIDWIGLLTFSPNPAHKALGNYWKPFSCYLCTAVMTLFLD